MSIKRTIITTATIVVAVAMVTSVAGAQTPTIAQLQAEIQSLLAQLQSLQGTTTTTPSGSVPAACVGITFTRNLTVGSTGSDVKCLQALLNTQASTQVSATGAGSPGYETTYFGPKTLAAVKIYQAQQGLTPANQVGPLTRAKLNAWLGGGVVSTPVTTLPQGCTTNSGYSPITGQSCGTGVQTVTTVTPTGAGLQVLLAADNPAAGIVVAGQGLAPLAKYVFVNGDNAPVTVTGLSITRVGISADQDLANVYLLNGATRVTDAASVSSGVVNFNGGTAGLFVVPAGSSTEITVASDICATGSCETIIGQTIGVSLVSTASITANASSIRGNFPVNGNLFTVSNASLATVVFGSSTSSPSLNSSLQPQLAYPIWQNSTVIGTRTVNMTRIAFRLVGSIYSTDLQNFVLNIDGVNVGSPVANMDSNGYVTFNLASSPVALQTGTRVIKVFADIVNGSSRNFYTSIRVAADANFIDSQYGVNIAPTTTTTSTTAFTLSDVTTGVQTISSGTLTINKSTTSPSGTIILGAANADLGDYTITAAGEPVKITDLYVYVSDPNKTTSTTASDGYFRNGAVYANGVQVGSTTNIADGSNTSGTHFSLGSSLIVNPGSPVTLTIKADVHEAVTSSSAANMNVRSGDALTVELVNGSTVAQDVISLGTPTVTGTIAANSLTVGTGSLTLSEYNAYTNQTVVAPLTNYMLAHFTLTSSSTEATNLNTIYVDLGTNNTVETNMYVMYGTQKTTAIANPSTTTAGNSWSINYQLPAGQTIDMEVFSDVNSLATTSTQASMRVLGTTASSATSVYTGATSATTTAGQTITFSTGSINAVVDGTTPLAQAVAGGQEIAAGKFKITSISDNYTVTEMKFTVPTVYDASIVQDAILKDSTGAVLATVPFDSTNGWFYFTGLTVQVPASTTKVLTVDLLLSVPSTNGVAATITTGRDVKVSLEYMKTLNGSGVMHDAGYKTGATSVLGKTITLGSSSSKVTIAGYVGTGTDTSAYSAANDIYVYKTIPTVTVGTASASNLSLSSQANMYNFSITAGPQGPVSVKQIYFNVAISDVNTGTLAHLSSWKFFRGSTDLNSVDTITNGTNTTGDLKATTSISTTGGVVVLTFNTEEVIPAGATYSYSLMATPSGFSCSSGSCDSASVAMSGAANAYDSAVFNSGVSNGGTNATSAYLASSSNNASFVQSLASTAGAGVSTTAYFIWSDNSATGATPHNYTDDSTASPDWLTGYLVNNLPLASLGSTAQ